MINSENDRDNHICDGLNLWLFVVGQRSLFPLLGFFSCLLDYFLHNEYVDYLLLKVIITPLRVAIGRFIRLDVCPNKNIIKHTFAHSAQRWMIVLKVILADMSGQFSNFPMLSCMPIFRWLGAVQIKYSKILSSAIMVEGGAIEQDRSLRGFLP